MPMNRSLQRRAVGLAALLALPVLPQAAEAHTKRKADRPAIVSVRCASDAPGCAAGARVAVRGERLAGVARVDFLGGRGRQDDRHAHPRARNRHKLLVRVPTDARSGPLRAVSRSGRASRSGPRLVVEESPAAPVPGSDGAFPVRGRHDYGTATNQFGGGRGHQGQDIFAACGTTIVAARPGRVVTARAGGNEGNYAVTEAADGTEQAYLHMLRPAAVRRGDRVAAGEVIGKVGETGNASGCHLHFELWTAPGRFTGGRAFDPRPDLDRWAASG